MIKKSDKINTDTRKAQQELQNREVADTLGHIKNKILVMSGKGGVGKSSLVENMSGLKCPYCGKIIEVFKTLGGKQTARKENLRLLATLPLELEVVKEGDAGVVRLLDNQEIPMAWEFNKMVDEIVKLTAASFSIVASKADMQEI
jgi:ABC-type cobalamin/Fe3+-siderophores transport system ATPase subunit